MPKLVDHNAQRHSIAAAAIDVIDVAGLDGARLRDVASAADVTTGAVTHYFDGKDALLAAAMDLIVARILEKQAGPLRNDVDGLIDMAAQFLPLDSESRRDWRVWLAFWGRAIHDGTLRAKHRAYYAKITARLAADLAPHGRRAGKAERMLADAIIAAIDGIGTRAALEPEDWSPKRQRETLNLALAPLFARVLEKGE
jgi:TetR/AcrR family transcriptional regulator, transcriptional repressor of bet genes